MVWQHAIPDSDELGDCTLTSYGTVFFNRKSYGAQEIKMDLTTGKGGEIVWEYRQDGGSEVHAVQPIGKDKVLVMQNANPAKLMIINKTMAKSCRSGMPCVEKLWPIMGGGSVHGMFRHVRILANGNLLVPFTGGLGKVVEYTQDNPPKVVWEYTDAPSAWAAVRLHNGNTLISGNSRKYVKEVTPDKQVVWELNDGDLPGISFYTIQEAMRLTNGNTIINNWCGGGPPQGALGGRVRAGGRGDAGQEGGLEGQAVVEPQPGARLVYPAAGRARDAREPRRAAALTAGDLPLPSSFGASSFSSARKKSATARMRAT